MKQTRIPYTRKKKRLPKSGTIRWSSSHVNKDGGCIKLTESMRTDTDDFRFMSTSSMDVSRFEMKLRRLKSSITPYKNTKFCIPYVK